ncbi:MAG: response regulator [candidate division WOR-3 bacterium]
MRENKGVIFVVEDDEDIRKVVAFNLQEAGYDVYQFEKGEELLPFLYRKLPDLFIIDIILPGIDGLELTKELRYRSETKQIPIIILTCRGEETDRILGLELGADDYITKPFSLRELIARVKVLLRRRREVREEKIWQSGDIILEPESFTVKLKGKEINLSSTEFKILRFLLENEGKVLSREKIINETYGYDKPINDRTIDVHIRNIRKKLNKEGKRIEAVRGVGYKLRLHS